MQGRLICDVKLCAEEIVRCKSYDLASLVREVLPPDERRATNPLQENMTLAYRTNGELVDALRLLAGDAYWTIRLTVQLQVLPLTVGITSSAGNSLPKPLPRGRTGRNEYLLLRKIEQAKYSYAKLDAEHIRSITTPSSHRPQGGENNDEAAELGPFLDAERFGSVEIVKCVRTKNDVPQSGLKSVARTMEASTASHSLPKGDLTTTNSRNDRLRTSTTPVPISTTCVTQIPPRERLLSSRTVTAPRGERNLGSTVFSNVSSPPLYAVQPSKHQQNTHRETILPKSTPLALRTIVTVDSPVPTCTAARQVQNVSKFVPNATAISDVRQGITGATWGGGNIKQLAMRAWDDAVLTQIDPQAVTAATFASNPTHLPPAKNLPNIGMQSPHAASNTRTFGTNVSSACTSLPYARPTEPCTSRPLSYCAAQLRRRS